MPFYKAALCTLARVIAPRISFREATFVLVIISAVQYFRTVSHVRDLCYRKFGTDEMFFFLCV